MVLKVEYEDGNLSDITTYDSVRKAYERLGALQSLYRIKALTITDNVIYVRIPKKVIKDVI